MDVFKVFESTVPEIQADYTEAKDLRRDQLLDNYDAAVKALQCLIKAKENELAYRRALVEMLEQSKSYFDRKEANSTVPLNHVKKYIPDHHDQSSSTSLDQHKKSTTSTLTPQSTTPISSGTTPAAPTTPSPGHHLTMTGPAGDQRTATTTPIMTPNTTSYQAPQSNLTGKNSDLDPPMQPLVADRTSLDNRLSEFLKTYPILSQAGLAAAPTSGTVTTDNNNMLQNTSNNIARPSPGYYTQQPPPPPPPTSLTNAPPLMAMMRYPPPPMIPPPNQQLSNLNLSSSQENHETADMDLSDHDEPISGGGSQIIAGSTNKGMIPMVASAMQQGAGGKHGLARNEQSSSSYGASGYNNTNPAAAVQYTATSRMSALPFDPSIMDPTFSSPMSSGSSSRDKHSSSHNDRGSHRHSSSGGSSGSKHGSDKSSKYSSSSQSSKNKRR